MKSPKQWLRLRFTNFVLNTVGEIVRPSDFINLNSPLSEIRTQVVELGKVIEVLNARMSDTNWQSHIEKVTVDLGSHLNSVHEEVRNLGSHLNSVHEEMKNTRIMLQDLIESHKQLQEEFEIQKSQVRAKPYSTGSIEILSSRDSRVTIGYEVSKGGNYVDFIENFRPTFSELQDRLAYVTTWLPSAGDAVDLGAGRGEMVQVLREYGLTAYGIDSDQSVVSDAKKRKIDVRPQEINDFLNSSQESILDVITAIQVVEHVDTLTLETWFQRIRNLLRPGGVFIAETPNPHAIDAFKAFWIDTTHVRPYYPESLLHMAQKAGFSSAEIWVEGKQHSIDERLGYAGSYTLIAIS